LSLSFIIRESLRGFRYQKGSFFFALSVNTLLLFLFFLFLLITANLFYFTKGILDRVEISVFLEEAARPEALVLKISKIAGVEEARFISKEEALKEFSSQLGEDSSFIKTLGYNPLPPSIRVKLNPRYKTFAQLSAIEHKLYLLDGVKEVFFGKNLLARLYGVLKGVIGLDLLFFGLVGIVLLFVSFRISRLDILQRKGEIEIMELSGATRGTIRGIFLFGGLFQGLLAGLFSFLLCYATYGLVKGIIPQPYFPIIPFLILQIGSGGIIGVIGPLLALK